MNAALDLLAEARRHGVVISAVGDKLKLKAPSAPPPDVDLVLHGHTHVPRHERAGNTVFLNPGCITRPNRGAPRSFAWLILYTNGEYRWESRLL